MGADFQFYKVKCKQNELNKKADDLRSEARYDHGHSGYTGTIAEDNGDLTIISTEMSESDAEQYIYDNAQKWESSIAVSIGKDQWLIGGCYSC